VSKAIHNLTVMAVAQEDNVDAPTAVRKTRWQKVQEIIWDGPRPKEERKLIQRLDWFLM
jgi:MFS transporter, ACS family, pantothenate transporter